MYASGFLVEYCRVGYCSISKSRFVKRMSRLLLRARKFREEFYAMTMRTSRVYARS